MWFLQKKAPIQFGAFFIADFKQTINLSYSDCSNNKAIELLHCSQKSL